MIIEKEHYINVYKCCRCKYNIYDNLKIISICNKKLYYHYDCFNNLLYNIYNDFF